MTRDGALGLAASLLFAVLMLAAAQTRAQTETEIDPALSGSAGASGSSGSITSTPSTTKIGRASCRERVS
jgi:hypothetical protein